jgi:hypothetical protein
MASEFRALDESELVEFFGAGPIARHSHEGAERMLLHNGRLRCEFSTRGAKSVLTVEIGRMLSVTWSDLRTE